MRPTLLLALALAGCKGPDGGLTIYNVAPTVAILTPADGTSFDEGTSITLEAQVSDDADLSELTLTWNSDLGGELQSGDTADAEGVVSFTTANLEPGNHLITLTAVDADSEPGEATVTLSIVDLPEAPEIAVIHPAGGEHGTEGEPFEFVATVSDAQDGPDALLVSFASDIDGTFCEPTPDATGAAKCEASLSGGDHFLTYTVTDTAGTAIEATAYFVVTPLTEIDNDGDGFTETQGDCDDTNSAIKPTAPEVYNSLDDDCDTIVDEGTEGYDDDGDGWSEVAGDCNDLTSAISPSAIESCGDGTDNNCNLQTDEENATGCHTYYYDFDGDTYGTTATKCLCAPSVDYDAQQAGDCYDYNVSANPQQSAFQGVQRGDGSFDYNCDNTQTKRETANYYCDFGFFVCIGTNTDGWVNGTPACGVTAAWGTGCTAGFGSCGPDSTQQRTQECL